MNDRLLRVLGGIIFGLVVAAITAEIVSRLMIALGILPNHMVADIFDSHSIGWRLEPGLEAKIYSSTGLVDIEINDMGFRDDDYPVRRGRYARMLVLGDDFTLALETPQEEVFHVLLEERYDDDVEVITMAASGYEIVQDYLVYENIGRKYDPDVVLLMLHVGSDLTGNRRWDRLPYYVLNDDGTLTLRHYPFRGELNLPLVIGQRSTPWMERSRLAFLIGVMTRNQTPVGAYVDVCSYQRAANFPDITPENWALSEALLEALRDSVVADGARFLVVIIPTEFQVEQDYLDQYTEECGDPPAGWLEDPPQERLKAMLREQNITYLDLLPRLRAARAAGDEPFYLEDEDIHWTSAGHEAVASALFNWLALDLSDD